MIFKKCIFVSVILALALLCGACAAGGNGGKVSAGLDVLAERAEMVKTGLVGQDITFTAADFERALNLSTLTSITVTKLPVRADGTLYLGSAEVSVGQVIPRANLGYLTFSFGSAEIRDSSFCFSIGSDYEITCDLRAVESLNHSPAVADVSEMVRAVSTYQNIVLYGRLDADDPEGDALRYEIVTRPENGLLEPMDAACSAYRYIPNGDFVGKDSFRYVAVDTCGNYSSAVTVTISVGRTETFVFEDLLDSGYHVPAIAMAEDGVMASTEMGGKYYFHPEATVSRMDFLVMAMRSVGLTPSAPSVETVFADDDEIPTDMRPYVNTAERMGYICGKITEDGTLIFAPNDPITVAEAAVILANMTRMDVPTSAPTFEEGSTVPAWAADAVFAMSEAGVFTGAINASVELSRGEAAEMLYALSRLAKR